MRFVIHEHRAPDHSVHWDLMLEQGDALKTFRLDCAPSQMTDTPCQAAPIFDHDKRFLTYEGPVQKGLGQVRQVDRGTYESIGMTEQTWTVNLHGEVLCTGLRLPLLKEGTVAVVNI